MYDCKLDQPYSRKPVPGAKLKSDRNFYYYSEEYDQIFIDKSDSISNCLLFFTDVTM